jgi:hypothetical protein
MPTCKVLEHWSVGVLGLKAEIGLIFTLLPWVMRDPNMVYIFPLYQPFINPLLHHSITPILQVRLTSSFDKEGMAAVYQRR